MPAGEIVECRYIVIPDALLLEIEAVAAVHGVTPIELIRRFFRTGFAAHPTKVVARNPSLIEDIETIA